MEANPSCLVWWLDAHCGYFVMCHERQLMFGHCILGDFRHLSWMPNLLLSLSRNLTKRWQKCDIRQSSIGQMLKSHFCHLLVRVCSFRCPLTGLFWIGGTRFAIHVTCIVLKYFWWRKFSFGMNRIIVVGKVFFLISVHSLILVKLKLWLCH